MANDPTADEKQDTVDGLNYFKLTLYIIIFIAGLFLNTYMFLAVTRKRIRHRRTARSFIRLIQNLACADILLLMLVVPFDSGWWKPTEFPYGGAMCKILWPLRTASFQAIVLTYVMLSFHRTYGVKQALFGQMNDIFIIFLLFMIWIGSLVTVVPFVIFLNYDVAKLSCIEMWPLLDDRRSYSAVLFLLQYLLPLMVLVVMYFVARAELKNAVSKDRQLQKRAARHRRVNNMLIVYIAVFAFLILPEQINRFVMDFGAGNVQPYFFAVIKLLYFLTLCITVTNPILFFFYNPEFRKDLTYFLQCSCAKKQLDSRDAKSESFSVELPPPGVTAVPYAVVDSRTSTYDRRAEAAPEYPGERHSYHGSRDVGPSKERLSYHGSRDPVIPRTDSREKMGSYHGSREKMGSYHGSRDVGPRTGSRQELPPYGPEEPYPTKSPRRDSRERLPFDEPHRGSRERLREEPLRRSRERLPSYDREPPYRSPSRERLSRDERPRSRASDEPPYRTGSREPVYRDRDEPHNRSPSRERMMPEDEPPYRGSRERLPPRDEPYRGSRERLPPRDEPYRGSRERLPPRDEPYREQMPRYEEPYRPPGGDVPYRAPRREDFPPRDRQDPERRSVSSVHDYDPVVDDDQGSEML